MNLSKSPAKWRAGISNLLGIVIIILLSVVLWEVIRR